MEHNRTDEHSDIDLRPSGDIIAAYAASGVIDLTDRAAVLSAAGALELEIQGKNVDTLTSDARIARLNFAEKAIPILESYETSSDDPTERDYLKSLIQTLVAFLRTG